MLTTAVQWELIMNNPAERVKSPKVDKKPVNNYDEEQTKALLDVLDSEDIKYKVMVLLKEYHECWLEQQLACGDLWHNSDRLFITWDGKPPFTYTLTNWFPEFLERHKLPKITPHGLRHTMASLLDAQGVETSAISKRLGHARISTTLDIYTHVFKKADTAASNILERTLLSNIKSKSLQQG